MYSEFVLESLYSTACAHKFVLGSLYSKVCTYSTVCTQQFVLKRLYSTVCTYSKVCAQKFVLNSLYSQVCTQQLVRKSMYVLTTLYSRAPHPTTTSTSLAKFSNRSKPCCQPVKAMLLNWSTGQSHVAKLINRSKRFSTVSERVSETLHFFCIMFSRLSADTASKQTQNCWRQSPLTRQHQLCKTIKQVRLLQSLILRLGVRGCWRHLIFHQPTGRLKFALMTESETQPGGYVQTPGGVDCNRNRFFQYLLREHL